MTNQTDQVTIDPDELRSLSNDMLMDVLHDCCNDRHPEFNTYWKEIKDRFAQPAPPVPGVSEAEIHKILNRYITHLQDIDDATDAVMSAIALAQTWEVSE